MGFKADTSFLKFLTMGALGAEQTMAQLRRAGFEPIELERYCTSNKLWATKVKRLRLPDVMCVRTGLRLEIRAKSDLQIKMSDAPSNPDRQWDSNMRDDDLAAFITIFDDNGTLRAADEAVFFTFSDLRNSVTASKLGDPKSASEGAERDRTWPACIPSSDGVVTAIGPDRITARLQNGSNSRTQTYLLRGKNAYVTVGSQFRGGASIIAGAPARLADVSQFLNRKYDPLQALTSSEAVDRYAAVKALRFREDLRESALAALEHVLDSETDDRISLEAAGSAAALESERGQQRLSTLVDSNGPRADLRMECVFILTELGTQFARTELIKIAGDHNKDDELREAAVWGLGKTGMKAYAELLPFLDDANDDVAVHAIAAFGPDTPLAIIRQLVAELNDGNRRRAAAASEVLRLIGSEAVLGELVAAYASGRDWVVATIGRFPAEMVRQVLSGSGLMNQLNPMLLLNSENWLASEQKSSDIGFLLKQNL